jgi:hypothetical protein
MFIYLFIYDLRTLLAARTLQRRMEGRTGMKLAGSCCGVINVNCPEVWRKVEQKSETLSTEPT